MGGNSRELVKPVWAEHSRRLSLWSREGCVCIVHHKRSGHVCYSQPAQLRNIPLSSLPPIADTYQAPSKDTAGCKSTAVFIAHPPALPFPGRAWQDSAGFRTLLKWKRMPKTSQDPPNWSAGRHLISQTCIPESSQHPLRPYTKLMGRLAIYDAQNFQQNIFS